MYVVKVVSIRAKLVSNEGSAFDKCETRGVPGTNLIGFLNESSTSLAPPRFGRPSCRRGLSMCEGAASAHALPALVILQKSPSIFLESQRSPARPSPIVIPLYYFAYMTSS